MANIGDVINRLIINRLYAEALRNLSILCHESAFVMNGIWLQLLATYYDFYAY